MKTILVTTLVTAIVGSGVVAGNRRPAQRARTLATTAEAAAPQKLAASQTSTLLSVEAQNQLVHQYCATCHSDRAKSGGLSLANFDVARLAQNGDVAELMIRKLRAGLMPPPAARRPDATTVKAFVDTLETKIDAAAALDPKPGWRPFQRLNRAEYAAAVRDLLAFDVDVSAYLPPDTTSAGFDNVADARGADPNIRNIKGAARPRGDGMMMNEEREYKEVSPLPPVPLGGPGVPPLVAAAGVGYGEGFAGNTHRYAPMGMLAAVKYFVDELHIDVNAADHEGNTAHHNAAARGDVEMIQYLVSRGADVKAVNREGKTTADMANGPVQRIQPWPEALALLEKLGAKNNHKCISC
jgi:mono/diheme cytochrome c family protein